MLYLFGLWFACSDKESDSGDNTVDTADSADTNDTSTADIDCETISADECAGHEHCFEITGYPLDVFAEQQCYEMGDRLALGCMSYDMSCGEAITYSTSPDGGIYKFMDTCIPDGWETNQEIAGYSEGCSPVEPDDCAQRSVDECLETDVCTHIFGAHRTEVTADSCYELGEMTPTGCMSAGEACEPVVVNASDPSTGDCYQFNSGCTPADWGTCDDVDLSLSECATSCADQTPEQCSQNPQCSVLNAFTLSVDAAQECYSVGATDAIACTDADMICGEAITFAADATGACMMFMTTCVPEGWTYCEALNSYGECPS